MTDPNRPRSASRRSWPRPLGSIVPLGSPSGPVRPVFRSLLPESGLHGTPSPSVRPSTAVSSPPFFSPSPASAGRLRPTASQAGGVFHRESPHPAGSLELRTTSASKTRAPQPSAGADAPEAPCAPGPF